MNMKKSSKGFKMWKRTLTVLLSATALASATSVFDNQKALEDKVDSINAKRGVEIGGSIRAVTQNSYLDNDQDPTGKNIMPDEERSAVAMADLDFHFRPWENVRANVMLRLGAGMQEYFSSASKTLSVGWINVEGNIGQSFYWIVGDFRQQYSPLTMYAPGVDVMYEPTIFARKRHMAQKQELIEGNQRNLQGANVQFRHYFNDAAGELRAEALFARLNRPAVLDFSGAEGNIFPNGTFAGASKAANMDKWLVAGNLELLPLSKNLYVGVTPMYIFDNEDSFTYTYRHPENDLSKPYELEPVNPFDVDPQKTMVVSGRVGADVAGLLKSKDLTLDLVGEFAYSSDDVYTHTSVPVMDPADPTGATPLVDPESGEQVFVDVADKETLNGTALLVTLNAGYKVSDLDLNLVVDFVRNDSNWFNNLAQSPQFFAQRILNTDKDGNSIRYGVNAPLYSSFDALYNYVPKFSPASTTLATDDGGISGGQTESYNIAPFNKNSWGTAIYTRNQLALIETMTDPVLQLSLPNGLATSNRMGARGVLTAGWSEAAEVQGLFSMFNQVSPLVGFKEASYMEYGGGAKVDVFKLIGFKTPLEISGSYKHSERSIDTDGWALAGLVDGTAELKSDFINAGIYVQYLPRLGVTAGFQYITTEYNDFQGMISNLKAPMLKSKQMQWMVGLDYSLASNAWFSLNYGMISVENEYNTVGLVAAGSAEGAYNLPDYYDVTTDQAGKYTHEFTQSIIEASINVEF